MSIPQETESQEVRAKVEIEKDGTRIFDSKNILITNDCNKHGSIRMDSGDCTRCYFAQESVNTIKGIILISKIYCKDG